MWHGQRPWFEIWFAVVLDDDRRRALWIRQTLFVPRQRRRPRDDLGRVVRRRRDAADAAPPSAASRSTSHRELGDSLIGDRRQRSSRSTARVGWPVDGPRWDVDVVGRPARRAASCRRGCRRRRTRGSIVHDAEATGARVTVGGRERRVRGRALAMHLWGKRRVPTLHWIWTPWLGDGSLEVTAISLRESVLARAVVARARRRRSGCARYRRPRRTRTGLVTATVAGRAARWSTRARGPSRRRWSAMPTATPTIATLMVAQSDIGVGAPRGLHAQPRPACRGKPAEERRAAGGRRRRDPPARAAARRRLPGRGTSTRRRPRRRARRRAPDGRRRVARGRARSSRSA